MDELPISSDDLLEVYTTEQVSKLMEMIVDNLLMITNHENVTFTVEIETTKLNGAKVSVKRLKKIIHY